MNTTKVLPNGNAVSCSSQEFFSEWYICGDLKINKNDNHQGYERSRKNWKDAGLQMLR